VSWRPNCGTDIARARAQLLRRTRRFFERRNVLEVCTPALTEWTVTDPNIESITVQVSGRQMYLHTSPEYHMKRLLAAGFPDCYQVCRVFRDGEAGRDHLPEFTLIEWYRHDYAFPDIIEETAALATELLAPRELRDLVTLDYRAAFHEALGLDPFTAGIGQLAETVNADDDLRHALGDDRDAWLDLAMASRVAGTFSGDRLTAITHYPASQAALARLSPHNSTVAERFELFLGTCELANGFVELTDARIQRQRFETDRQKRAASGRPVHDIDARLIAALDAGLPPCAGVALGLDRLLMIDQGLGDIRDTVTFTPGERA
jgi:lysyl-tRNA synthetase class 2